MSKRIAGDEGVVAYDQKGQTSESAIKASAIG
jgi:hypothetical protein